MAWASPAAGLLLALLAAQAAPAERDPVVGTGGGSCRGGAIPAECRLGQLASFDWKRFLGLACGDTASRRGVANLALDVLAKFDADTARGCLPGFLMTMLTLMASGAEQWAEQVVRFRPDGSIRFLVVVWEPLGDAFVFKQYSVLGPAAYTFPAPFPAWPYPGNLQGAQVVQDLSGMAALPRSARCDTAALASISCAGDPFWEELLETLCKNCATSQDVHGLPCLQTSEYLDLIRPMLVLHRDRLQALTCPHGFLAALLSLQSSASALPPETSSELFRITADGPAGGSPMLVAHSCFKQVAQEIKNYFAFNIPLIDLSPFPFHSGMLRGARVDGQADPSYYDNFISLVAGYFERAGIPYVFIPGDRSVPSATTTHERRWSLFVPYEHGGVTGSILRPVLEGLTYEFGSAWRSMHVSGGFWQVGEEPYRLSPPRGVPFRVFCSECVYLSIYLYVRDGLRSLVPLAPWTPCVIPVERVFPPRRRSLPSGVQIVVAADSAWLRRSQRPPDSLFLAREGPFRDSGLPETCASVRRRLFEQHPSVEALRPPQLLPEFDLSDGVHPSMGAFDLMRQREDSEQGGLRRFSDKVQFKSRLLRQGVPIPSIYYMSAESPAVLPILERLGEASFVAKPTHLAATSFVYVMRNGTNLVNGRATPLSEVAAGLNESWGDRHVDDWATEYTSPGVIVEELIAPAGQRAGQAGTPDELKCFTFFGEVLFCEWVFVRNMTTGSDGSSQFRDAHLHGDRAEPALGHEACGIPNFQTRGFIFRDGTCLDCEEFLPLAPGEWERMVATVEHVAAGTDHIRIDVFLTPEGSFVVNEANISILKMSKIPPPLVAEMSRRWVDGYIAYYN